MTSIEIYNNFTSAEKIRICNLLRKGKDEYYLKEKYGISLHFTRKILWPQINRVINVYFGSKQESYYQNEMDYINKPTYNYNTLNEIEKYIYETN
tara:strand:- start:602 stop:886 length:285 start_codon:yes stop_codon:yes gene_type:complete